MKPRTCTLGKRHKWQFVRNVKFAQVSMQSTSLSIRGLYKCACGETKHGNPEI